MSGLPGDSQSSSPRLSASPQERAQSDLDNTLAQSLSLDRTRSSNTLEQQATPQRTGSTRRRESAYDQLADDLLAQHSQVQHEQDSAFFTRGTSATPSNSARRATQPPHSQQTLYHAHALSQNPTASATVARFYRQHRNLSDSSIDSQGGAYIDHRRHAPFLPAALSSATRNAPPSGGTRATRSHTMISAEVRRNEDGLDGTGHSPERRRTPSPSSPSRTGGESHVSTSTLRQRITTADLDENAIEDDDEQRLLPRDAMARHESRNYRPVPSPIHVRTNSYSNELSRAGSLQGKEDVCFPGHGAETADLIDLGIGNIHDQDSHVNQLHHHNAGVAGVLHNFPFPFDFGALEEFAERERDGVPIPGVRKSTTLGDLATSPTGLSSATRARSNDGGSARQNVRQRKLSESVAPGRLRQNLFDNPPNEDEPMTLPRVHTSILDVKTPLLPNQHSSKYGGGYGSGNAPSASGAARPYRFSFYSNALPSTIHARSLAEIPAEGQTFEELFVGHQADDAGSSSTAGPDARAHFSPPGTAPGTGAHTPVGAQSRASQNGARPGGIAMSQMAAAGGLGEKIKGGMMRTEVDAESNSWWLDVLCPTDQEMKVLSKVFGIHPLTTEDIQMEETREKIELFRNYYFVCFRSFEQDPYSPTYLEPLNMYIIVFREGTLSFHFRGTPHPQNVRRRIKQLKDYINVTSDWISYALIDDITDAFGPLIQNIEYEVDSIDELVLILKEAEQSDMLRRIGTCRKKVMGLLRLMGNKADVVKGLSKRCNENWSVAPKSDIGLYLSDIQDHITTSTQNLTHYEKILSRSHSNYLAQISIEMTDANNEINNVLSKLTALGTILIPLNLITGLWGMNVHVPGQDVEEGYTWFFSIIGALAGIALIGAYASYSLLAKRS